MLFIWGVIFVACSQKKEIQEMKVNSDVLDPVLTAEEWKKMGNEALDSTDYNKAIECFQEAIEVDSNYFAAYYNLGYTYYQIRELDKSIAYFNKAITKDDTIVDSYIFLGSIYEEKEDYDKAIEMNKKAYELAPNPPEEHRILAYFYSKKESFNYSKAHLMRAAQLGDTVARELFDNDSLLWKDTFLRPDYNQIESNIANKQSNLYYPKLWARFQQGDTTMTEEEVHHLYYGYVFDKDYSPFYSVHNPKQMDDILKKENPTKEEWEKLALSFDESIKAEPFNCLYLHYQSLAYEALNMQNEAAKNLGKMKCILHAQAYSGDGLLKETAIHVIAAPASPYDYDYLIFKGLSIRELSFEETCSVFYLEPNEDGLEEMWINVSQALVFMENLRTRKR